MASAPGDHQAGPALGANMLHLGFTDPRWRTLVADWDLEATRHVAMYRAAMTIHLDDPSWTALPARLAQLSPDFGLTGRAGRPRAPGAAPGRAPA